MLNIKFRIMGELNTYSIDFKIIFSEFHTDSLMEGTVRITATNEESAKTRFKEQFNENFKMVITSITQVMKPFY